MVSAIIDTRALTVASAPAKRAVPETRCWLVGSFTAFVSDMPGSSTISDIDDHGLRLSGPTGRDQHRDRAGDEAGDGVRGLAQYGRNPVKRAAAGRSAGR